MGQGGLCLLLRLAMPFRSLNGFLVGLEGALFLDCIEGCTHVHEKSLTRSNVPDGDGKLCVFPNGSHETLITFESVNRFLDGILFWHVGYRRTFL
jgi:hypothetical protein